MYRVIISLFAAAVLALPSGASPWIAANRVPIVGSRIVKSNSLPNSIEFKVVDGPVNNSKAVATDTIQINSKDLTYAKNDNELAFVLAYELGEVINNNLNKKSIKNSNKYGSFGSLNSEKINSNARSGDNKRIKYSINKIKADDIMGIDLTINAGYNPLASIVVLNRISENNQHHVQGKLPCNERAMYIYDYLAYNFPSKIKAGYPCYEYRTFLDSAEPVIKGKKSGKKQRAEYNKEQAKVKSNRDKQLAKFNESCGLSKWNLTYELLQSITEPELE